MPPKKQTFGFVPIPKTIHLFQSLKNPPLKKTSLEGGGITPSSHTHPNKPFLKRKKRVPNPLSPYFKPSRRIYNF